jgi:hypothetical protein
MNKVQMLAVWNLIALVIQMGISYIVPLKLINGQSVGDVSNHYHSLFTPANSTFAIWGLIYLSLTMFCIYHVVMSTRHRHMHTANLDIRNIGPWFIINNLAAAAWLIAWVSDYILISLILIIVQLISLIAIHINLGIYDISRTWRSKLFTQFPLSIYLGWITVATIANASIYLQSIGWSGWGIPPATWTIIMIGITLIIALTVVVGRRNLVFGLVIIWALYGIIKARKAEESVANINIINITWLCIGLLAVACLFRLLRNLFIKAPSHRTFPITH